MKFLVQIDGLPDQEGALDAEEIVHEGLTAVLGYACFRDNRDLKFTVTPVADDET